jgi:(1->4)-alpha-D-glucan 1-alpha-D-glucosylmutase
METGKSRVSLETPGLARVPAASYRLQFGPAFTFRQAEKIVSYLHKLGISDCYASPYFLARSGSLHGYDIADQNRLNPAVGSWDDLRAFVAELEKYDMGQILDVVPNHMSIFDNPKWDDVLENGPNSIYARYFDIDWSPAKPELREKVLLPILEGPYGAVLEGGLLQLGFENGAFFVRYREHGMPLGPKTMVPFLQSVVEGLRASLSGSDPDFLELQSVITALQNLPDRNETSQDRKEERHREKEIIKKRLAALCLRSGLTLSALSDLVAKTNGKPGNSSTFGRLHEILEKQAYRLSFWKVAAEEINYRRFFDINELVALRTEDPQVFEETHRLVRRLYSLGYVTGLRIDHVDGLFDPSGYLRDLQRDCWLESVRRNEIGSGRVGVTSGRLDRSALKSWEKAAGRSIQGPRPVYIIVEKILAKDENLNRSWPVEGTTGYDFSRILNGLFIQGKHENELLDIYRWFTGGSLIFEDVAYGSKNIVMKTSMAGEVNVLARCLAAIAEKSWQYRDFTLNSLHDAIREVLACFPVYRSYVTLNAREIRDEDREIIRRATSEAKGRNPAVNGAIFDFVADSLTAGFPQRKMKDFEEERLFAVRFQQVAGPVMAKGLEDTALYRYMPLASLCEVGDDPRKFGTTLAQFHQQNLLRQRRFPDSFNASSTHDSKRSEDVRARINVLSEIPDKWKSALSRWRKWNSDKKLSLHGISAPDANDEYLIYQTLIGTFPEVSLSGSAAKEYGARIKAYMLKAVREAKVHTSWINPNPAYEEGTADFIERILDRANDQFLGDFKEFNKVVVRCGFYNSLSQVVLKAFCPGVPDFYQGSELFNYSLVDPDNRGPVDFELREQILDEWMRYEGDSQALQDRLRKSLVSEENDLLKLFTTWKTLAYRRGHNNVFKRKYIRLAADGSRKDSVCSFARASRQGLFIVAVPRFTHSITLAGTILPLGKRAWQDTAILLPRNLGHRVFRNIFSDEDVEATESKDGYSLPLRLVFSSFPVAGLASH